MKRILHVIAQYPGKTGSGIYLKSIMEQADKREYSQGLIAAISIEENIELKYTKKFYPVVFNSSTVPFPILGMSDNMPYESMKYSSVSKDMMDKWESEFKKVLKRAIDEFKPNLIISHHLWLSTSFVTDIAKNIKTIGICHGTDLRQIEKSPQYRARVLLGCGKLDIVFALNNEQKKMINNIYNISKDNIIVVGGGYNEDIFYFPKSKRQNKEIEIIYAGKLSYAKGLTSLLKVFDRIKDKYNIKLLLAGTGMGEEERSIKELGKRIGGKVVFLGGLKQAELAEKFRKSDIFVLPSFYEGLSLVVIESLASGLRVVTTNIPGLKDYLGEEINRSNIIEYVNLPEMMKADEPLEREIPAFENELKRKIEKQIYNVLQEKTIGVNTEKKIEKLSWKSVFSRMEQYLQ